MIQVDLIDRAGTRYHWATVEPDEVWPHVEGTILGLARVEAEKMHGTVQAYDPDDPERSLP